MKQNYFNIFKYPGNKTNYLGTILPWIKASQSKIYIEPFFGSGTIYFNSLGFAQYIVNDKEPHILNILNTFNNTKYEDYLKFENFVLETFGNIATNYDAYYKFRDYVNNEHRYNEYNFGIFFLNHTCMNSMMRFGPNGFNQTFGNRPSLFHLTKTQYEYVKHRLVNTKIITGDFSKTIEFDTKDSLYVLDPPYDLAEITYNKGFELNTFQDFLKEIKGKIIYTDIENEFADKFFSNKILLKNQMKNISPNNRNGKHDKSQREVMYTNFDIQEKLF
jgi:DNA adenine methylase